MTLHAVLERLPYFYINPSSVCGFEITNDPFLFPATSGMASSKGVALVTGGARGIGRSIALRLADDGFDVAINDLPGTEQLKDVAAEIEGKGRRTHISTGDVSQEQDVIDMIKSVVDTLGGIDVMVANAGILLMQKVFDTTVEAFDRTYAINVRGVMLCYKYAAAQMVAQGRGGRLIAASSLAGKRGSPFLFSYSASKFAVRGLTHVAATELAQYGITVNVYCPGATDTRMLTEMDEVTSGDGRLPTSQAFANNTPMGRTGVPTDVANVVSFLASKESGFITGQSISVDGGSYLD
ncbi:NAD(P)-binding protein [Artomyces pyxidatus]|uniref:NAD(P)-binding protein n=1 Tax=Artomyces pyxidatus TaxID=48021 RepID=A0ACB8TF78_9AGAM|nr:NAD(P)-binding protein [Artomyces pyxidatus]